MCSILTHGDDLLSALTKVHVSLKIPEAIVPHVMLLHCTRIITTVIYIHETFGFYTAF